MLQRLTAAACVLVLLVAVATVSYRAGLGDSPITAASGGAATSTEEARLDALREVLSRVQAEAVTLPKERDALVDGAIEGALEALEDPYAEYYDPEEFTAFNEMLDGEFSGVGLVLEDTPKGPKVVTVLPNTPAARAGIETGERIVSVDGKDVRGKPIDTIVNLVKGEEGTDVTLGLAGGKDGRHEVTLTRQRIDLPNIESRQLGGDVGYVRLQQFSGDAGDQVRTAVDRLLDNGAGGIVLDLRGNPGGLLGEAVKVASVFMEDGEIVSVQERGATRRTYEAEGDALEDVPVAVLVDRGSASASEIVAGALQDADRAELVGTPTFGKGTVQTIERLDAGGGVKFTTAKYFTPSGDSIEKRGVRPDQRVRGRKAQLNAAEAEVRAELAGAGSG